MTSDLTAEVVMPRKARTLGMALASIFLKTENVWYEVLCFTKIICASECHVRDFFKAVEDFFEHNLFRNYGDFQREEIIQLLISKMNFENLTVLI